MQYCLRSVFFVAFSIILLASYPFWFRKNWIKSSASPWKKTLVFMRRGRDYSLFSIFVFTAKFSHFGSFREKTSLKIVTFLSRGSIIRERQIFPLFGYFIFIQNKKLISTQYSLTFWRNSVLLEKGFWYVVLPSLILFLFPLFFFLLLLFASGELESNPFNWLSLKEGPVNWIFESSLNK